MSSNLGARIGSALFGTSLLGFCFVACGTDATEEGCRPRPPCIAGSRWSASLCACIIDDFVDGGGSSGDSSSMSDARADAPAPGDASTSGDSTLSREASLDAATSCEIEESSTLPHVRFAFRIQDCTFTLAQAAAGISIPYDLIVEADVPGFVTSPYPSGPTTANLDISENLAGGSQGYCVCDRGKRPTQCPLSDGGTVLAMTSCDPVTLPAGTYHRAFQWDGHNWSGPSDTNNPKGALFPAGDYVLAVETREGTIGDGGAMKATGKITIHLVP